ncbi:hypothetical protein [Rhizobium sp. CF142]|uniref:hypothetical protein n=1 Tax=Rhizobium sp. CF142 TaxID=1144314 RepID=UPI0012F68969|nr:hypothetical protein [Rhizobium sp. CF142]
MTVVNFGFHWTLTAAPRLGRLGRLAYLIQNSGSKRGFATVPLRALESLYPNFRQWHRQCIGENCDQNSTDEGSINDRVTAPSLAKNRRWALFYRVLCGRRKRLQRSQLPIRL